MIYVFSSIILSLINFIQNNIYCCDLVATFVLEIELDNLFVGKIAKLTELDILPTYLFIKFYFRYYIYCNFLQILRMLITFLSA